MALTSRRCSTEEEKDMSVGKLVGELTQQQLKSLLVYDPATGLFTWTKNAPPILSGRIAGAVSKGYRRIKIYGVTYGAHRLVWLYAHGVLPDLVDHINGQPDDNRLENLRLATAQQNSANSRKPSNNTSGAKGVQVVKGGRFRASVHSRGVVHYLGTYDTLEEAKAAYIKGADRLFADFATHGDRNAPTQRKRKVRQLDTLWIRNAGVNDTVTPMHPGQKPSTLRDVSPRVLNKILREPRREEKRKKAVASAMKSLPKWLRDKWQPE